MCPVYYVNDVTGLHHISFPFKGESKRGGEGARGMGMGSSKFHVKHRSCTHPLLGPPLEGEEVNIA